VTRFLSVTGGISMKLETHVHPMSVSEHC